MLSRSSFIGSWNWKAFMLSRGFCHRVVELEGLYALAQLFHRVVELEGLHALAQLCHRIVKLEGFHALAQVLHRIVKLEGLHALAQLFHRVVELEGLHAFAQDLRRVNVHRGVVTVLADLFAVSPTIAAVSSTIALAFTIRVHVTLRLPEPPCRGAHSVRLPNFERFVGGAQGRRGRE